MEGGLVFLRGLDLWWGRTHLGWLNPLSAGPAGHVQPLDLSLPVLQARQIKVISAVLLHHIDQRNKVLGDLQIPLCLNLLDPSPSGVIDESSQRLTHQAFSLALRTRHLFEVLVGGQHLLLCFHKVLLQTNQVSSLEPYRDHFAVQPVARALLIMYGGVHVVSDARLGHGSHRGRKKGLGFVIHNMILGRPRVKYNVLEQGKEENVKI